MKHPTWSDILMLLMSLSLWSGDNILQTLAAIYAWTMVVASIVLIVSASYAAFELRYKSIDTMILHDLIATMSEVARSIVTRRGAIYAMILFTLGASLYLNDFVITACTFLALRMVTTYAIIPYIINFLRTNVVPRL